MQFGTYLAEEKMLLPSSGIKKNLWRQYISPGHWYRLSAFGIVCENCEKK
jgi:hypothetical protein